MTSERRYEEPAPSSRDELASALDAGDDAAAVEALLGVVLHDHDGRWCQDRCVGLLDHPSPEVRRIAVVCLGHIARIHRRPEIAQVVPALIACKDDPHLAGAVADALDDIDVFVRRPGDSPDPPGRSS